MAGELGVDLTLPGVRGDEVQLVRAGGRGRREVEEPQDAGVRDGSKRGGES